MCETKISSYLREPDAEDTHPETWASWPTDFYVREETLLGERGYRVTSVNFLGTSDCMIWPEELETLPRGRITMQYALVARAYTKKQAEKSL